MPRRAQPQPVLQSSSQTTVLDAPTIPFDNLPSGTPRRRDRNRIKQQEKPGKPDKQPKVKKRLAKRIAKWGGIVALLLLLVAGGFLYKNFSSITGNKNPLALLSAFTPAKLKNQDGRVNILVAGNSADDKGHDGASLTDSIMVLSVNTKNNTALMLSIPRDLWVDIPVVRAF